MLELPYMRILKLIIGTVIVFFAGNLLMAGFNFIFNPEQALSQQAQGPYEVDASALMENPVPMGIALIVLGLIGVFGGIKFIRWVLKDA